MSTQRTITTGKIEDLAERLLLSRASENDPSPYGNAVFLVGAGASISAGIPSGQALAGRLAVRIAKMLGLASGLKEDKTKDHEQAFSALQRAKKVGDARTLGPAYGTLFGRLSAAQQRDFVRTVIRETNQRQINWAHLAMGELVRQRMVHTLLTTNFDDLLLDGLVRSDLLPAIVDGVESLKRLDSKPPVPQLVYLHGSQHTYNPRNSTQALKETKQLASEQGGLFTLLRDCSVLVVVGYAGNSDEGIMDLLINIAQHLPELTVYWIAYGQHDSLTDKAKELLSQGSNKFVIAEQDADLFFKELLTQAKIGVPECIKEPVQHMQMLAQRISVSDDDQSTTLRAVVADLQARLEELQPAWVATGKNLEELRELREFELSGNHQAIWQRLSNQQLNDTEKLTLRAEAAYELGRTGLEQSLPQAVSDGKALVQHFEPGSNAWANAQDNLGNALYCLGELHDVDSLKEAIQAYRAALQVYTREGAPTDWAGTMNNLGNALSELGEQGHTEFLPEAISTYREALDIYTREVDPENWANVMNGLGNALTAQGEKGNAEALLAAIATFEEALKVYTREADPLAWAMVMHNLGLVFGVQAEQGNAEALLKAISAFEAALEVYTREASPLSWARTIGGLGEVLHMRGDTSSLYQAIKHFEEALTIYQADSYLAYRQQVSALLDAARAALAKLEPEPEPA